MRLKLFYVHLKTAKWAFGDVFNAIYHVQIDVFSVYLLGTDLFYYSKSIYYQLSQGTVGFSAPLVMKVFSEVGSLTDILMFESFS